MGIVETWALNNVHGSDLVAANRPFFFIQSGLKIVGEIKNAISSKDIFCLTK